MSVKVCGTKREREMRREDPRLYLKLWAQGSRAPFTIGLLACVVVPFGGRGPVGKAANGWGKIRLLHQSCDGA